MNYEEQFLIALFFTIAIETIVLLGASKLLFKKDKIDNKNIIFAGFFASFATLPYLWFLLPSFLHGNAYIAIGEILVVIFETFVIAGILKINLLKSLLLSFLANLTSFILGLWILPFIIHLIVWVR